MNPQHIPPPPDEVFDFIDELELTARQDHDLENAMVIYHYRVGWSGHPLKQPIHVLLGRMIEVGIPVSPCVTEYLEKIREQNREPRG
jgi:hypothetical protein